MSQARAFGLLGAAEVLAGVALILGALWGAGWFGSGHGLWGSAGLILVGGLGALILALGVCTLRWRRTAAAANLSLLAASWLVFSPLMGEVLLRGAIGLGWEKARRAGLYADPLGDDLFYQLERKWLEDVPTVAGRFDPVLGWSPPATPDNPLGLMEERPYTSDLQAPSVLFYGDSFIAGASLPDADRLPQMLDRLLPDLRVYNFGVGGFGLDQIYLRFADTHRAFRRPLLVFGLLTTDLDRSLLTFRTGPKPYFVLEDGRLELRGAPMEEGSAAWRARFEPRIRSYLWALLRRSWQRLEAGGDALEAEAGREEKEAVNRAILARLVAEAREAGGEPRFVIFPANLGQGGPGWREAFLAEELGRLGVPSLDVRALLEEEAARAGRPVASFFLDDGHLNADANRVVAARLARLLEDLEGEPPPS